MIQLYRKRLLNLILFLMLCDLFFEKTRKRYFLEELKNGNFKNQVTFSNKNLLSIRCILECIDGELFQ